MPISSLCSALHGMASSPCVSEIACARRTIFAAQRQPKSNRNIRIPTPSNQPQKSQPRGETAMVAAGRRGSDATELLTPRPAVGLANGSGRSNVWGSIESRSAGSVSGPPRLATAVSLALEIATAAWPTSVEGRDATNPTRSPLRYKVGGSNKRIGTRSWLRCMATGLAERSRNSQAAAPTTNTSSNT